MDEVDRIHFVETCQQWNGLYDGKLVKLFILQLLFLQETKLGINKSGERKTIQNVFFLFSDDIHKRAIHFKVQKSSSKKRILWRQHLLKWKGLHRGPKLIDIVAIDFQHYAFLCMTVKNDQQILIPTN